MITVNLRPDLKRKRRAVPLARHRGQRPWPGLKVKDPLLLLAVVSWVGVLRLARATSW